MLQGLKPLCELEPLPVPTVAPRETDWDLGQGVERHNKGEWLQMERAELD